jgi:hypothetical protein
MLEAVDSTDAPPRALDALKTSTFVREKLLNQYRTCISHNPALHSTLVSFQANKRAPFTAGSSTVRGFRNSSSRTWCGVCIQSLARCSIPSQALAQRSSRRVNLVGLRQVLNFYPLEFL